MKAPPQASFPCEPSFMSIMMQVWDSVNTMS
jgi:hypothetical protein